VPKKFERGEAWICAPQPPCCCRVSGELRRVQSISPLPEQGQPYYGGRQVNYYEEDNGDSGVAIIKTLAGYRRVITKKDPPSHADAIKRLKLTTRY
jgi:hypothetical protein